MGPMDSARRRAMVLRIRVSGRSSKSTEDGRPKTEDETCAAADGPAASAASMSRLMMRPAGPLPETLARLMPRSSARRLARGLENVRPAEETEDGRPRTEDEATAGGDTAGGATGDGEAAAASGFAPCVFGLRSSVFGPLFSVFGFSAGGDAIYSAFA